jgi:hypothetical protein
MKIAQNLKGAPPPLAVLPALGPAARAAAARARRSPGKRAQGSGLRAGVLPIEIVTSLRHGDLGLDIIAARRPAPL